MSVETISSETAIVQIPTLQVATAWESRIQLVKDKVAKTLTETEFELFLYLAKTYHLDPLLREIWAVKYAGEPAQIYAGRDGFLKVAHLSGQFDGMSTVLLLESGGSVIEADISFKGATLLGAKCTVWRKDMGNPVSASVALHEYNTGRANWKTMPDTMIRKVAEAHALRRAFSIHGLYMPEEMDKNVPQPGKPSTTDAKPVEPSAPLPEPQPVQSQKPKKSPLTQDDTPFEELPAALKTKITEELDALLAHIAEVSGSQPNEADFLLKYGIRSRLEMTYKQLRRYWSDLRLLATHLNAL